MKAFYRICYCLIVSIVLISAIGCSSEKSKIKKALKSSVSTELQKDYKFVDYIITETLLTNNVRDSITVLKAQNSETENALDQLRKLKDSYQEELEDCQRKQRNTLYFLRSAYTTIIDHWQDLINKTDEKIRNDSTLMMSNIQRINFYEEHLNKTESPIIFYKVRHNYSIRGAIRRDDVVLDANYELINF